MASPNAVTLLVPILDVLSFAERPLSTREIAAELGVSRGTVSNVICKHMDLGKTEVRGDGARYYLYYIPKRAT